MSSSKMKSVAAILALFIAQSLIIELNRSLTFMNARRWKGSDVVVKRVPMKDGSHEDVMSAVMEAGFMKKLRQHNHIGQCRAHSINHRLLQSGSVELVCTRESFGSLLNLLSMEACNT